MTETGVNTGVFRNTTPLPSSTTDGLGPDDGTLNVLISHSLSVDYNGPLQGDGCNANATVVALSRVKPLYLDTDGSDGDSTGDLDRVDPVTTGALTPPWRRG